MPSDRPNIIFIITDQQRYDTIAALGFDHVDTPHLDRLVREGVTFTHAWSNPVCGATRGTLMTGQYGVRLGPVVAFLGQVPLGPLLVGGKLPIAELVYAILFEDVTPVDGVKALLARDMRAEFD